MSAPAEAPVVHVDHQRPSRLSPAMSTALWLAGLVALAGAPVGLLWMVLATGVPVQVADGGATQTMPESDSFVAVDGVFFLLTLAAGALTAWLVLGLSGRYPTAALLGATAGSLGGALMAWQVGQTVSTARFDAAVESATAGTVLAAPLDVLAPGVLLAWPVTVALLVFARWTSALVRGRI